MIRYKLVELNLAERGTCNAEVVSSILTTSSTGSHEVVTCVMRSAILLMQRQVRGLHSPKGQERILKHPGHRAH